MEELRRAAIVLSLLKELGQVRSRCGETHIQKAIYFLQELMSVPLGFAFILYKYGPYSFDLNDEIASLRADGLIRLEPYDQYGACIVPGFSGKRLQERFPKTLDKYGKKVQFVARELGPRKVADLERLSTALYVTRECRDSDHNRRAERISELKPHVRRQEALKAINEVEQFIKEAGKIV